MSRTSRRAAVSPEASSHPTPDKGKKPLSGVRFGRSGSPRKREAPERWRTQSAAPPPARKFSPGSRSTVPPGSGTSMPSGCAASPTATADKPSTQPSRREAARLACSGPLRATSTSRVRPSFSKAVPATPTASSCRSSSTGRCGPIPKKASPAFRRRRWRRGPISCPGAACVENRSALPERRIQTESESSRGMGLSPPASTLCPSPSRR